MSDVVYASSIDKQARIKAVQQIAHRQLTLTALPAYTFEFEARLVGHTQRHTQLALDVRNHHGQRGVRGAWERRRRRNDAS